MSRMIERVLRRVLPDQTVSNMKKAALSSPLIDGYLRGGRIPWSPGYSKFKNRLLIETFANAKIMETFRHGEQLPAGYGARLDERVVECPWALAHIRPGNGPILDAGSVLNAPYILDTPYLNNRMIVVYSLEMDWIHINPRISYVHGDFRKPILRDGVFDTIVCVSTLEHVGMWQIPKPPYDVALAQPQPAKDLFAYRDALKVFRDLLAPGGQLLLTVPYGRQEDHDWLQQFDAVGIRDIVATFGGELRSETYFGHFPDGWRVAGAEECANLSYFNIVRTPDFDPDYAAAARAVACLHLIRPE